MNGRPELAFCGGGSFPSLPGDGPELKIIVGDRWGRRHESRHHSSNVNRSSSARNGAHCIPGPKTRPAGLPNAAPRAVGEDEAYQQVVLPAVWMPLFCRQEVAAGAMRIVCQRGITRDDVGAIKSCGVHVVRSAQPLPMKFGSTSTAPHATRGAERSPSGTTRRRPSTQHLEKMVHLRHLTCARKPSLCGRWAGDFPPSTPPGG